MNRVAFGVSLFALSTVSALAALPEAVETKMEEAAVDGGALAALGLLIVLAIAAIKYLRRGV